MVTKAGKYYGRPFITWIGVTQGDPVSPTLFIIIVYALFRATLQDICGTQDNQQGFRWLAGEHKICFYEDDRQIAGRDQIWVEAALTAIVRILERVGLYKNLNNTKAMICTPGFI